MLSIITPSRQRISVIACITRAIERNNLNLIGARFHECEQQTWSLGFETGVIFSEQRAGRRFVRYLGADRQLLHTLKYVCAPSEFFGETVSAVFLYLFLAVFSGEGHDDLLGANNWSIG